jgi:hypothetical protein
VHVSPWQGCAATKTSELLRTTLHQLIFGIWKNVFFFPSQLKDLFIFLDQDLFMLFRIQVGL